MFFIDLSQAKKVVADLEAASERGFIYSLAVLEPVSIDKSLGGHIILGYPRTDLWDRAHPTDGNLDWGRQGASSNCRVLGGKLVRDGEGV